MLRVCYLILVTGMRQTEGGDEVKLLLKSGVLNDVQKGLNLTDQQFAEYIGVSRSQLWRAKMPPNDKRFSLGQDFIAKLLSHFPEKCFDDFFFLDCVSHACDDETSAAKEVI